MPQVLEQSPFLLKIFVYGLQSTQLSHQVAVHGQNSVVSSGAGGEVSPVGQNKLSLASFEILSDF